MVKTIRLPSPTFFGLDDYSSYGMTADEWSEFWEQYGSAIDYNGASVYAVDGDDIHTNKSILRWLAYRRNLVRQMQAAGLSPERQAAVLAQAGFQHTDLRGADAETFYNDRENASNRALAEQLDASAQDSWNNPVNQVSRDRAAGINDALSGEVAGDTPAADAQPSDSLPSPGLDPAQRKAQELAQADLVKDSILSVFSGGLSLLSQGMQFTDMLSQLSLRSRQEYLVAQEAESKRRANRDSTIRSLTDTFVHSIPLPKDGANFDPATVMDAFPRGAYSSEELGILDELVHGGYFFDQQGKPSTAIQKAYAGDLAGAAGSMLNFASAGSKLGDWTDPSDSILKYYEKYQRYDDISKTCGAVRDLLATAIDNLQVSLTKYNVSIAGSQARSASAQADMDEAYSDYQTELYNGATGSAEKEVQDGLRRVQVLSNTYNQLKLDFETNAYRDLIEDFKKNQEEGRHPIVQAFHNFWNGLSLNLLTRFAHDNSTAPDITPYVNAANSALSGRVEGGVSVTRGGRIGRTVTVNK